MQVWGAKPYVSQREEAQKARAFHEDDIRESCNAETCISENSASLVDIHDPTQDIVQ